MADFLSHDSGFGRALALVADVALVSLCISLTAIPVVTLGAGLAAGNRVIYQLVREEGSRPWAAFWRTFVRGFKLASAGWIPVMLLSVLAVYEAWVLGNAQDQGIIVTDNGSALVSAAFRVGLLSGLLLIAMIACWYFPIVGEVVGRGGNAAHKIIPLMAMAMGAALRYAPRSMAAILMWAAPIVIGVLYPRIGAGLVFFYIVFIPAFTLFLVALMNEEKVGEIVDDAYGLPASSS